MQNKPITAWGSHVPRTKEQVSFMFYYKASMWWCCIFGWIEINQFKIAVEELNVSFTKPGSVSTINRKMPFRCMVDNLAKQKFMPTCCRANVNMNTCFTVCNIEISTSCISRKCKSRIVQISTYGNVQIIF